jgi:hypothetical protein
MDKNDEKKIPGWHVTVREMPTTQGFSYPIFEWSYGFKDGLRGGEVRAWPIDCALIFKDRRDIILNAGELQGHPVNEDGHTMEFQPEQLEKLIFILEKGYGWGEPPNIKNVLAEMVSTSSKIPGCDKNDYAKLFIDLKEKWEKFVN